MQATLLVELLTEELPPKALKELAFAFADKVTDGLLLERLVRGTTDPLLDPSKLLATPRRLAILVPNVLASAEDISKEVDGPPVTAKPEAVMGFAKKQGVDSSALQQRDGPKGKIYFAKVTLKGATLDAALAGIVADALKKLSIQKLMRWGDNSAQFVRPVHGLVMLHGDRIVPGKVLGIESDNATLGHRFLSKGSIVISSADAYAVTLEKKGRVIADFEKRRERIRIELEKQAAGANTLSDDALLDEVTALVEWPAVYAGTFDKTFLEVPQECLVLSMQQHQRYFPLADADGKLLNRFLMVSNMQVADPANIVRGNERVLRARLSDAKFFYDRDRKERLEDRVPRLAQVVYHNKLGSQLERVERIQLLAGKIARELGIDPALAERAAWLSKADLLTDMVGEFPELQGAMGRYYALHDSEPKEVADAIEQHYWPRFAGDALPSRGVATVVAIADKVESLVGMFGISQLPSGDKDPFALRRAALGLARILAERGLPITLMALISDAASNFGGTALQPNEIGKIPGFILDRLRSFLRDAGYEADEIEAVIGYRIDSVIPVIKAVREFRRLPEASSLASANKRVQNILRQNYDGSATIHESLLTEPAERALYNSLRDLSPRLIEKVNQQDYTSALCSLAGIREAVDTFFDKVLVNTKDDKLRRNRLALLGELQALMNQVADISKLAIEK